MSHGQERSPTIAGNQSVSKLRLGTCKLHSWTVSLSRDIGDFFDNLAIHPAEGIQQ